MMEELYSKICGRKGVDWDVFHVNICEYRKKEVNL